jgi:hypothetical protein
MRKAKTEQCLVKEQPKEIVEQLKILKASNGYILYLNLELKKPLVFETTEKLLTFIELNFRAN